MAETRCCCGLITVRKGSRYIARAQFWSGIVGLPVLGLLSCIILKNGDFKLGKVTTLGAHQDVVTEMNVEEIVTAVCFLFMMVVINICSGHILLKATFDHNLQYITIWLTISGISTIKNLDSVIALIIFKKFEELSYGLIFFSLSAYLWYVVYQFYNDEKHFDSGSCVDIYNQKTHIDVITCSDTKVLMNTHQM